MSLVPGASLLAIFVDLFLSCLVSAFRKKYLWKWEKKGGERKKKRVCVYELIVAFLYFIFNVIQMINYPI